MRTSLVQQIKRLGLTAAIAAFAYQPAIQASSQQINSPSPTAPMIETLVAAAPDLATAAGKQLAEQTEGSPFVGAGHPTSGNAKIVEVDGQRYLEFDEAFSSDSGPDLFVLLHREAEPQSYSQEDYVSLGRIQSFSGAQRYAIPEDVNLSDFQSAVIWCRQFNVTFGYATL
ncbi:MAG: DM13 domain-containing protein [Cyanobacteria bacterium J06614_10]